MKKPLTVAWISDFPVEWLPDAPEAIRSLPRRHPATWQLVLLAEFERDPSVKLHVILFRGRIAKSFSFERNGVTFHVIKAAVSLRLASLFWLDTKLIRKVCAEIQPDIVHAWGMEKGAGLIASRLHRPFVFTVQGLFAWYKQMTPLGKYDKFTERLENRALPRARVVTTESAFAVKFLGDRYPKMRVIQAEHAPNRAFAQVQRRPQTSPIHFISIGGLSARKGTDLLIKALDRLRKEFAFRLTIVTDPEKEYLDSLRASASRELWDRIEIKVHLPPDAVARELETATMLLLPTRADTSPNAVKEAAVAGVPVVASSVGGITDYIYHGKNGLVFPVGDLEGFVRAIRTACAHPRFGKGEVDPATLAWVRDYLSPEKMAGNFLYAYRMCLEQDSKTSKA